MQAARHFGTSGRPATVGWPSYGFAFKAMSSACEVRLEGDDEAALSAAAQRAVGEVLRIERTYSRYRDDSIVSRINAAAGSSEPVEIDAETAALLSFAGELHAVSGGLFDITSGVLRRVWDFRAGRPPDAAALAAQLPLIGWQKVELGAASVRLPRAGMELDFGGFGKEYAVDRAATLLVEAGVRHGFVNLGGDIRVVGPRADGSPWRFGIAHPRVADATIASVEMTEGALATSGDYERYFEHQGRRYCHILDPLSGWPVQFWASISVTAPACLAAGAMSTIAMLEGRRALDFLATRGATFLAIDTKLRTIDRGLAPPPDSLSTGALS